MNGPTDFTRFGLHADLLRAIDELGYTKATAVQSQAIPAGLRGRDVLACAMTGSGKTAAFLLPILEKLRAKPKGTTRALVLTPTRELAAQIVESLTALSKHTRVRGAAVYGGVGMEPQEEAFRRGVDVIVATPGRLLDHFQHDYARLDGLEVLVLDEADRMLDMEFLPAIRQVLAKLPRTPRQTLFFSATMPAPIVSLSRELLRDPVRIDVERKQAPATGITQALYPVPANLKVELLYELLRRDEIGNAIVFCRTKHRANRVAEKLEKFGITVARIHGNRSQAQRTDALGGFKSGRYRVLVATDIVARGIDVEALEHVVNLDVPNAPEDYIHRVGRTARAEATGDAYTFVSPEEEHEVRDIERKLDQKIERRTVAGFNYNQKIDVPLEVPLAERIAGIRARKSEERARARANAEKKAQREAERAAGIITTPEKRGQPHRRRRRRRGPAKGAQQSSGQHRGAPHRGERRA